MVEEGVAELDAILHKGLALLPTEGERAQAALDGTRPQVGANAICPDRLENLCREMGENVSAGDIAEPSFAI
jgi:hypothetical protein